MKTKLFKVLKGDKAVRVIFTLAPNFYMVVKFFDLDGVNEELWTVKIWCSSNMETTISHWRTKTPVIGAEAAQFERVARERVSQAKVMMSKIIV